MSSITASEMKYLLTIEEIGQNVKMVAIAKKLGITKASVFHSIERLEKKNLVKKEEFVALTADGEKILSEFHSIRNWMKHHLVDKCGVPEEIANEDSINVICSLSDVTREKAAAVFAKSGLYGNCNE